MGPRPPGSHAGRLHSRKHAAGHWRVGGRLAAAGLAGLVVLGLLLFVVAGPVGGALSDRGTAARFERAIAPVLRSRLSRVIRFPGKQARLPFPRHGEAAVVIPGLGVVGATPSEQERPIASLTKMMTAYIILKDHPLSMSAGGPVFKMTLADHKAWVAAAVSDESNLEVKKGERLDERQLLEALMIPSADNIADYLAKWDAGSVARFVAKMNAEAATLGLRSTHYADASGLDPSSRSTALDQAILAGALMANPVLRSIVDRLYVKLPIAGRVWNVYNPAIHVDGIIGVKSGFTQAAHGCLATAAFRLVGRSRYLVVSVAIGMPLGLDQAANVDEHLLKTVSKELSVETVVPEGAVVATAVARWDRRTVDAGLTGGPLRLAGWPGLVRRPTIIPVLPSASRTARGWPAGISVGTLALSSSAGTVTVGQVVLRAGLPPPPAGWTPSGSPK